MFKVGLFLGVLLNVCAVWAIDVDFKPFARVRYESLANYDLNGGDRKSVV